MIDWLLSWFETKYPVSARESTVPKTQYLSMNGRIYDTPEERDAANVPVREREREEAKTMMARVADHPAWMHLSEFAKAAGSAVGWGKNYRRGCGPGDWRGYYAYIVGTEDYLHGNGETLQLAIEDLAKIIRGRRIVIQHEGQPPKSWDVPPSLGIYQPEYPPGLSFVKEETRGD